MVQDDLETAATDGRDVFVNPSFFLGLPQAERDGLLVHELLHAALLHLPRRGRRNPVLWNIAADIVVNGIIDEHPDLRLPAGALRDPDLASLPVEEVYAILLPRIDQLAAPAIGDLAAYDSSTGCPDPSVTEAKWRRAIGMAEEARRLAGTGALGAKLGDLDEARRPQLDWKSILWRFLVHTPVDFGAFDRRHFHRGLYLETLEEAESLHVWVAVDTSGSVSKAELAAFLGELRGIANSYPRIKIDLFYADAALYGPHRMDADARIPEPEGGGGTDFRPFFERAVTESGRGFEPAVLVYLTDGFGAFPDSPPRQPVLWVVCPGGLKSRDFPFGEVARLV